MEHECWPRPRSLSGNRPRTAGAQSLCPRPTGSARRLPRPAPPRPCDARQTDASPPLSAERSSPAAGWRSRNGRHSPSMPPPRASHRRWSLDQAHASSRSSPQPCTHEPIAPLVQPPPGSPPHPPARCLGR
eukprot:757253-Hanusia_phi.AAC.2